MKILVAVDGSDYSRMAIEFIASRKTLIKSNPNIQVLNVQWPLPPHPRASSAWGLCVSITRTKLKKL